MNLNKSRTGIIASCFLVLAISAFAQKSDTVYYKRVTKKKTQIMVFDSTKVDTTQKRRSTGRIEEPTVKDTTNSYKARRRRSTSDTNSPEFVQPSKKKKPRN